MKEYLDDSKSWAPTIAKVTFLLLTVVLLCTVIYLLRNVLHAIILGVILAGIMMPLNNLIHRYVTRFANWLDGCQRKPPRAKLEAPKKYARRMDARNRWISSIISVILVFCIIVLPLSFFAISVAKQGRTTIPSAIRWIDKEMPRCTTELVDKLKQKKSLASLLDMTQKLYAQINNPDDEPDPAPADNSAQSPTTTTTIITTPPTQSDTQPDSQPDKTDAASDDESFDPGQVLVKISRSAMQTLWNFCLKILSKAWLTLFNFFIMLFVMFHVFHDGPHIWRYLKNISPLGDDAQKRVVNRVKEVSRAILFSIFGTAIIQGLLAMLFFRIVGIPALFWGFLLGLCSIIPFVGTGLVWVPAVIYLFMTGQPAKAIFIIITCGGCVANIDSIIRPFLMKKGGKTGMSYMVLFFSILGGLQTFGLVGVIYGPLITGMCSICLLIFSTQFKSQKNPEAATERETPPAAWLRLSPQKVSDEDEDKDEE